MNRPDYRRRCTDHLGLFWDHCGFFRKIFITTSLKCALCSRQNDTWNPVNVVCRIICLGTRSKSLLLSKPAALFPLKQLLDGTKHNKSSSIFWPYTVVVAVSVFFWFFIYIYIFIAGLFSSVYFQRENLHRFLELELIQLQPALLVHRFNLNPGLGSRTNILGFQVGLHQ